MREYKYLMPITGLFTATLRVLICHSGVIALPLTLFALKKHKHFQHQNYFHTDTNFNPFTLKVTNNV